MNDRSTARRTLCICVFFAAAWTAALTPVKGAAQRTPERRRAVPDTILFAVLQNRSTISLDPVVIIRQGRYVKPPAGDASKTSVSRFAASYYRPGQRYRLVFGGGNAGEAIVKEWGAQSGACARTEGVARLDTRVRISGKVMGLATNSVSIGRGQSSRRAPTAVERAAVLELAKSVYRQKRVQPLLVESARAVNVTATDLNGDGKPEIIASFVIKNKKGIRFTDILFLIAERQDNAFKAGFIQYGRITEKDIPRGADIAEIGEQVLAEVLVDQVDLDRDGTAEVIVTDRAFEGVAYRIFKKQERRWRQVYEFYTPKCAG